jgi:hypothetical protein
MANGDAAAAAGLDIVPGTAKRNLGYDEINKTRDYIALTPIVRGGTGATTAAQARTNLGAMDAAATADTIPNGAGNGSIQDDVDYVAGLATAANTNANNRLPYAGGSLTGHLYSMPARTGNVTSNYVPAYLNADGRLGAPPLAKGTDVTDYEGSVLDLRPVTYVGIADPLGATRLGLVADEAEQVEPLVVAYADGQPASIRYDLLSVALLREVQRLAERVAALEAEA